MKLIENLLNKKQKEKLKKWKSKKRKSNVTIGGRYTYEITPTGLGLDIQVKDNLKNDKLNLTDSKNW